jgi:uncharacterized membrane protein YcaP (DUF421 family)
MDGVPLLIADSQGLKRDAMEKERVTEEDILHAARDLQGLASLAEVKYAILEQTGEITIVPKHA